MPLRLLLPFLEGAVRLLVEQARNAAVVRSLRRSENLQVREDLTKLKQRYACCLLLCRPIYPVKLSGVLQLLILAICGCIQT